MTSRSTLPYGKRAEASKAPLLRKLFAIAELKKSNVTVSADVTSTRELLELADRKQDDRSFGSALTPPRTWPLYRRIQNPHRYYYRL